MKKLYWALFLTATLFNLYAQSLNTCNLIKDISTGTTSGSPSFKYEYKGKVYMRASTAAEGAELWVTDGTAAGTTMIKDIRPGTTSSNPNDFIEYKGIIYFSAITDGEGLELWRTDGTNAGTRMVKDIATGTLSGNPAGGSPSNFIIVGDKLLFRATDGVNGLELWETDGTEAGTKVFKEINQVPTFGSSTGALVPFKGKWYFSANDSISGAELWVTDGTAAGTRMLKDINPGKNNNGSPLTFVALDNWLIFRATDSVGTELWRTDGTEAGTVLLKDIFTGRTGTAINNSNPTLLTRFGNRVIFTASDTTGNTELWITDGTNAGTRKVKEINATAGANPQGYFNFNGKVYFRANDGVNGIELWETDGTEAGTKLVKDINTGSVNSSPFGFVAYGKKLYFQALEAASGTELWESDGTSANTKLTCDINPGSANSGATNIDVMLGGVLFSATTAAEGTELYHYRTAAGVNTKDIGTQTFALTAKPSVLSEQTTLEILSTQPHIARLTATNLMGQTFLTKTLQIAEGTQQEIIHLGQAPQGLYFLTLTVGDEQTTIKVIKQ